MTYVNDIIQWHITWHIRFGVINPGKSYTVHHDICRLSPWHITWWLSWHIYMIPLHDVSHDIYLTLFSMPVNPTQFTMTYVECQHDISPLSPWHITWHMSPWRITWHINDPFSTLSWYIMRYVLAVSNGDRCHVIRHVGYLSSWWYIMWYVIWYVMVTRMSCDTSLPHVDWRL